MLEGEYDLDYRSKPNRRGNSHIRLARLRILGGCSTANTMIAWRPLRRDLEEWAEHGADGWGPDDLLPYYERLKTPIHPVAAADRNPFVADAVKSASRALGVPEQDRWNDGRLDERPAGAGFFEVGYTPETNLRASTSIHYLHPARAAGTGPRVLTGACVRYAWSLTGSPSAQPESSCGTASVASSSSAPPPRSSSAAGRSTHRVCCSCPGSGLGRSSKPPASWSWPISRVSARTFRTTLRAWSSGKRASRRPRCARADGTPGP